MNANMNEDASGIVPESSAALDRVGWQLLAHLEELSADCFNRPLLAALCERFGNEARDAGYEGLAQYADAKASLQRAVIAEEPTLDAARQYFEMKRSAGETGEPLLESIATAKLAAAVSQSYVGIDNILFDASVRGDVERMLERELPDLQALSRYKLEAFSEAVGLALTGERSSVGLGLELLWHHSEHAESASTVAGVPIDTCTRAVVGSGVGIANEQKLDLDHGHEIFEAVLKVHPTFLAARLAAFYNRAARAGEFVDQQASLVDKMREHLQVCVDCVPQPVADALVFSDREHQLIQTVSLDDLYDFVLERKSAPIRAYAEHVLGFVERYEQGKMSAEGLQEAAATFGFPVVRKEASGTSFLCAVENSWRARLAGNR